MIDLQPEIINATAFIISGILGMFYAYCWRWVDLPTKVGLFGYLFADKKAFLKVILVFISTCAGTIGLEYLANMSTMQIVIAGISLGLLIPKKVENAHGRF